MAPYDLKLSADLLTERVIGAALEVHTQLGPGLLESIYANAMELELRTRQIEFASEIRLPVQYKGATLKSLMRLDLLVAGQLVVEVKAVETLLPIHHTQVLTYLRIGNFSRGLLINFNVRLLKDGVRRLVC